MRVVGRHALATLKEFDIFAQLRDLNGPFAFLRNRGAWWWGALALGALLRLHFVAFTEGTYDVLLWESHAVWIRQYGLIGYYEWQEMFNAPPFMGFSPIS